MLPLSRGYHDCSLLWERTRFERTQATEQEQQYRKRFLECVSQYPRSIQESIQHVYRQHGLHAASLAVDALETADAFCHLLTNKSSTWQNG